MAEITSLLEDIQNAADGQSSRKPIADALDTIYNSGGPMTTFGGYDSPEQFATKEEVKKMFSGTKGGAEYNAPYILAFDSSMKNSSKSITSDAIAKVLGDVDSLYKRIKGNSKYNDLMEADYTETINGQKVTKKYFPNGVMVRSGGN